MKHIKLFEQFIAEAAPVFERDARVTAIRAKLNDALEEIRDKLADLYSKQEEYDEQERYMDPDEFEAEMSILQDKVDALEKKRGEINQKLEDLKGK